MTQRKYGWRPDKPDIRDERYQLAAFGPLPEKVDLRKYCSAVQDQGTLGSCTGNAIASALEFLENKNGTKRFLDYSRLFIYYNERALEGTVQSDAGAEIRDGVKAINKWGCCFEKTWPYVVAKFAVKPSTTAFAEAKLHLIKKYQRLNTLDQMKNCLASGYPFVFGFSVYASFESDAVARTGAAPMPQPNEELLGGHAVLGVGYDNATERVTVQNSWGTEWGQAGFFTLPYAYLTDRNLSDDFWVIKS